MMHYSIRITCIFKYHIFQTYTKPSFQAKSVANRERHRSIWWHMEAIEPLKSRVPWLQSRHSSELSSIPPLTIFSDSSTSKNGLYCERIAIETLMVFLWTKFGDSTSNKLRALSYWWCPRQPRCSWSPPSLLTSHTQPGGRYDPSECIQSEYNVDIHISFMQK